MSSPYIDESVVEAYVYETEQMIENLEQLLIQSEKEGGFTVESINEIFRFMHTIKGSSAMMTYNEISTLAHRIEDVFYVIREEKNISYDFSKLVDIILESIDFFKIEMMKIKNEENLDGDATELIATVAHYLNDMKEQNNIIDRKPKKKKETTVQVTVEQVSAEQVIQEQQQSAESPALDIAVSDPTAPMTPATNGSLHHFRANIHFTEGCEMENIRAYMAVHNLEELAATMFYKPAAILEDETCSQEIKTDGFKIVIEAELDAQKIKECLEGTSFFDRMEFEEIEDLAYQELAQEYQKESAEADGECDLEEEIPVTTDPEPELIKEAVAAEKSKSDEPVMTESQKTVENPVMTQAEHDKQHEKHDSKHDGSASPGIISVNVEKLDKLMDMVGELVIAEAMVSQNPEVMQLEIESFEKATRQLHKISTELQDMVMAIRMVPLSTTFLKMHRIVRDMAKKLNKNVELDIFGEETEVDKNIIEKIADPLMHIIRNSLDHGIEDEETRLAKGKDRQGTITLEAKNSGSDVLIIIRDDGKGLDREVLYKKALEHGLVNKPIDELTDREIYRLIMLPGFSTKEEVTEFSGRGVGMDVVCKNIESIGGSVVVDSELNKGTTIILKIPLTLAIIEGMNIRVGNARFTLPIVTIKQSFRPKPKEIIKDTEGQEMIMVRGECYPIIRLHDLYQVESGIRNAEEGILIMVEEDERRCCLFADELLGQQQIVVKSLPNYIKKMHQISGIGGCTLLGDGNISLILDVGAFNLSRVADQLQ